jgi:hypothetical protein
VIRVTRVLAVPNERSSLWWFTALALTLIVALSLSARGATLTEDAALRLGPDGIAGDAARERLVVDPEPEWNGWGGWHDGWHGGGPRIDVWVDRGDRATYRPGDRLWVFFRVDRPCFVTIIDYAPDGRVDVVYPNRWSGSSLVRPGRTYRVPESRLYSLRIAGPGRGVSPSGVWPVPEGWRDRPSDWGCDSVSFHVVDDERWGGAWNEGLRLEGGDVLRDRFTMERCADSFSRDLYVAGRSVVIRIECTESRSGDPTEIVGRVIWGDGRDGEPLFRIDVDGRHGERPAAGRVYTTRAGPLRIDVEVGDFEVEASSRPWAPARIDWIRFDLRAFIDR